MIARPLGARSLFVVLGAAVAAVAFACGEEAAPVAPDAADASTTDAPSDDAVGPDAAGPSTELAAFCAGSLALHAPRYAACCDADDAPKRYKFDHTLLTALGLACNNQLGASIDGGRATFDGAAATTCAANVSARIAALTCPEVLRRPTNQDPDDIFDGAEGCGDVMVGKQAAGQPCRLDYECVDGLTCVGWSSDGDGVCATPPGDGAPCGYGIPDGGGFIELVRWGFGEHPRCAAGFYCASTATQQGTCKASKADGGACSDDVECAAGLRCQNGLCGTAGPGAADAPCKRTSDCQGGLFCKTADGGSVCAARGVAGTPCSNEFGSECQGACVKPDGGTASCVSYCGAP